MATAAALNIYMNYEPWTREETAEYIREIEHEIESILAKNGLLLELRSLQQQTIDSRHPLLERLLDAEVREMLDLVCIVLNYRDD